MSALGPAERLNECFTKPKPNIADEYWHWMMKNRSGIATYSKADALQSKVDQFGRASLEKQGPYGWTPLHVACLQGNVAGAEFLLQQKVPLDVEDEFHKTPLDYAKKFPQILRLFQQNHPVPDSKTNDTPFLAKKNTNDFGLVVKRLHFSGNSAGNEAAGLSTSHFLKNMKQIADEEGFKLTFSRPSYFPRDHLFCLEDGQMISGSTKNPDQMIAARDRSLSRSLYFGKQASWRSMHIVFQGVGGSSIRPQNIERALYDYQEIYHTAIRPEFRIHIEGGDVFTLTNKEGRRKILIGEDQLCLIHAQCRQEKIFDEKDPQGNPTITLHPEQIQLTDELLKATAEEMYSMGQLKLGGGKNSGYIGDRELEALQKAMVKRGNKDPIPSMKEFAIQLGLIAPFELSSKDLEAAEPIVRKYLAQREIVLDLLSKSFKVPKEDIHFIPKAAYHLDVFLTPGPRGSLFIQDYGLCVQSLTAILEQADANKLSPFEKAMLLRYLETAKLLDKRLGPLLADARGELERAGFTVHKIPGIFLDSSWLPNMTYDPKYHVNFMNANSGYSEKQGRPYLITAGAQVGPKLGKLLMREFEKAIKIHQPDLKVHFIGYNPEKPAEFSQAMVLWNGREGLEDSNSLFGGVHCMSIELETASRQYS